MRQYDWIESDGDNTLAIDWPGVGEDSIIFDIGGYKGRWALQMAEKYNPIIYFFEPQNWAAQEAKEELKDYKVTVYNYGLWTHRALLPLGDFGRDGASLLKPDHADMEPVMVVDIDQFIALKEINYIDVCLLNVEGGEFVLIPYMIGTGIMEKIGYFWCQFHLFVQGSDRKLNMIKKMMSMTHDLFWDCGSTAMAWKRRL